MPASPAPMTATDRPLGMRRASWPAAAFRKGMDASRWLRRIAMAVSYCPRRQTRSQGAVQTWPSVAGKMRSSLARRAAASDSPFSICRSMRGMFSPAGQMREQGASQSPTCSSSSMCSTSRRASCTFSQSVSISMPSAALAAQAGSRRPEPLSRTAHIMHEVSAPVSFRWHSVGISTPAACAASSSVAPSAMRTSVPFILSRIISPPLPRSWGISRNRRCSACISPGRWCAPRRGSWESRRPGKSARTWCSRSIGQ